MSRIHVAGRIMGLRLQLFGNTLVCLCVCVCVCVKIVESFFLLTMESHHDF